jgi:hypothetical protein
MKKVEQSETTKYISECQHNWYMSKEALGMPFEIRCSRCGACT